MPMYVPQHDQNDPRTQPPSHDSPSEALSMASPHRARRPNIGDLLKQRSKTRCSKRWCIFLDRFESCSLFWLKSWSLMVLEAAFGSLDPACHIETFSRTLSKSLLLEGSPALPDLPGSLLAGLEVVPKNKGSLNIPQISIDHQIISHILSILNLSNQKIPKGSIERSSLCWDLQGLELHTKILQRKLWQLSDPVSGRWIASHRPVQSVL